MRGANQFRVDMPRMVAMYLDGRLDLDSMLSSTMSLADVNEGYASMGRGEIARSVIVFEEQARRHRPHPRTARQHLAAVA